MITGILSFLFSFLLASSALANPYLPKPGEKPLTMRVSTCAVSGGFVHLYTALDNGLFDKYGIKLENIFIRGSAQNLTALATEPPDPPRRASGSLRRVLVGLLNKDPRARLALQLGLLASGPGKD